MTAQEKLEVEIGPNRVLVVNSTMEAKEIVSWQDAVTMLYSEKAYTLLARSNGEKLRSATMTIEKPTVIVLVKYAQRHNRVFDLEDAVTKSYVRQRDNFVCAYCGNYGNTVDHIMPYSRGGKNTWGNLVTACKSCNGRKADRTPKEAGMKTPVIKTGFTVNAKLQIVQDLMYESMKELY